MNALSKQRKNWQSWPLSLLTLAGIALAMSWTTPLHAQALGWEGETGVFVTPLAYTASSETQKFHPVVAYHFLDLGPVIGELNETSIELGIGKVNLLPENYRKTKWVPAISTGFIARPNVRNVGNWVEQSSSNPATVGGKANADFYAVASKVVPTKPGPILLSAGVRGTDAELWGMGGNAPDWQARAFGAVAFVFKLPGKSTLILAS